MNLISVLDLRIEQALYAARDPSLVQFFIWVTELGSSTTVAGLALIIIILLAYRRKWPEVTGFTACILGSLVVRVTLKNLIARPRPSAAMQAYLETGFSFPSGHAILAVAFYVFVLWLVYDTLSPVWRKLMIAATTIIVLAIGFSRLYLGVHHPSDVLAGYALGGLFVFLGIKVAKKLRQRTISS